MNEFTDDQLWRRAAGGDARAFGGIYERHDRAVLSYLLWKTGDPSSAEDLCQVVFLEAWRRRGDLALSTPSARPLLLGIARNVAFAQWRSRRRHRAALERLGHRAEPQPDDGADAVERVVAVERLAALRGQLDALPHREREVLALTALADLTYEEVAATLGLPVGTVRSRLARARGRLSEAASPPGPLRPEPNRSRPTAEVTR